MINDNLRFDNNNFDLLNILHVRRQIWPGFWRQNLQKSKALIGFFDGLFRTQTQQIYPSYFLNFS